LSFVFPIKGRLDYGDELKSRLPGNVHFVVKYGGLRIKVEVGGLQFTCNQGGKQKHDDEDKNAPQ
jgi:hypothetical protein